MAHEIRKDRAAHRYESNAIPAANIPRLLEWMRPVGNSTETSRNHQMPPWTCYCAGVFSFSRLLFSSKKFRRPSAASSSLIHCS